LSEQFENIISFISDYRVDLMNHFLGNIFEKKIPERQPKDKKYKILKEIATTENIEKSKRKWLKNLLKQV